ncbi:MAG: ribonuclease Z [Clostridiales bacterium]|jgi:ribonuclease Z|nr:ribonuclease Z [Clostridiales bacterium]
MLDIALLGCGGMMPLSNRYLTALLCRLNGSLLLIDCGEATQVTMKTLGWGFKNLDTICITHFHADHISGLPGLLLMTANSGREDPITIIGPQGVAEIVRCLTVIASDLPFELEFIEIPRGRREFSVSAHGYGVSALHLNHGAVCYGYSLSVPRGGKFDLERAKALNLPVRFWNPLQKGSAVEFEGRTYTPDMVLGPARKGIKATYVTDTRPAPSIPDFARGSDIFICEGLYGDPALSEKAREHKHMTFTEAARLAVAGGVSELWLTHFSPAMQNPKEFIGNARAIFPNTYCGYDRKTATILFEDEDEAD